MTKYKNKMNFSDSRPLVDQLIGVKPLTEEEKELVRKEIKFSLRFNNVKQTNENV